jgi:hypothetical protein
MDVEWESDERRTLECVQAGPYEIRKGDRVRLCPKRRADVMDLVLKGKIATIEAIEMDFEDRLHLALVIEDDPGADLGFARQVGHRFFFGIDEVEPLQEIANDADPSGEALP